MSTFPSLGRSLVVRHPWAAMSLITLIPRSSVVSPSAATHFGNPFFSGGRALASRSASQMSRQLRGCFWPAGEQAAWDSSIQLRPVLGDRSDDDGPRQQEGRPATGVAYFNIFAFVLSVFHRISCPATGSNTRVRLRPSGVVKRMKNRPCESSATTVTSSLIGPGLPSTIVPFLS